MKLLQIMTNKELISKEEVLKLIEYSKTDPYIDWVDALIDIGIKVLSLPTFSPEKIINEMIEECDADLENSWEDHAYEEKVTVRRIGLQQALGRIRAENIS